LASQFGVSSITVKRAVIDLVNEGLLYRKRGKGTFVISSVPEKEINSSVFFASGQNETTIHKLLNYKIEKSDLTVAKVLEIELGEEVINIQRLGIEDGEPMSIEYTYLPKRIYSGNFIDGVENELIYNIIKKKYNLELSKAKNYFSGTIANPSDAKLLNISKNTPLFVWERITQDSSGVVVEYSRFIMRQDKEKYYLEVNL
uniref:GntR family transcriptional regulator n=1 Tax=Lysinibacillus capsici TaxID=2115968 RepID=UPI002A8351A6